MVRLSTAEYAEGINVGCLMNSPSAAGTAAQSDLQHASAERMHIIYVCISSIPGQLLDLA